MKVEKKEVNEEVVSLDLYDSDLNLVIDASGFSAHPLTHEGFAFMWAGARSTHGITKGKICFEIKVVGYMDVSHLPVDEPSPHVIRVGFSAEKCTSMQLGEEPLSYGYGGTGKISTNCQFKDYGQPFVQDDVILAFLNMDSDPVEIGFAKNGRFLGWAFKVNKQQLKGYALFPHILTKNCSFEVNFGQKEKPFFNLPDAFEDYKFIGTIPSESRERGTKAPEKREDCEMIMMCGLPGAGKSTWAAEYTSKNPEKKYNVLGTNNIIDKMKVMGLSRKRNYHGRWDVLIQMATKCLNKMFDIGSKLRRNYILDQTNVYPNAQRRKMKNFDGFTRKAVVIVPTDEEFKRRCDKREKEEGKEIPDHAVLEMKANFKLPEVCEFFDEVVFTELPREKAQELVEKYNEEGRGAVGPAAKRFRSNDQQATGGRGGRNSSFDRDRDRGGSWADRSDRGGRGGFNSPGPRNMQTGFGQQPLPRGGYGGGRGGRGGFGGKNGSGGQGSDYRGGYGGGFQTYGDNRSGGFSRGSRGGRGNGGGSTQTSREPSYNDRFSSSGGYGRDRYSENYGNDPKDYGGGAYNEGREAYSHTGPSDYRDVGGFAKRSYDGSFKNDSSAPAYASREDRGGYSSGNVAVGYGGNNADRGGYGDSGNFGDEYARDNDGGGYGGGYNSRGGRRGGFNDRGSGTGYSEHGNRDVYGRGSGGNGGSNYSDAGTVSGFSGTGGGNHGYSGGVHDGGNRSGGSYRGGNNGGRYQSSSQPAFQSDQVSSSSQSQSGYGAYSSGKSSEQLSSDSVSSTYPGYNQSSYSSYSTPPSSGYQSYGYQSQGVSGSVSNQQWSSVSSSSAPTQASNQSATNQYQQQQWNQYYQQPSYNQYYGQQGGSAASGYGTSSYGSK